MKANEIIVHCSATKEYKDYDVEDIRKWHKERGFKDIGYHFVITRDGIIQRGRPMSQFGAHCRGHNKNSIGICYVGGLNLKGFPSDTRTVLQKMALIKLINKLLIVYPSITSVVGHNKYSIKACPCFDAEKEYEDLVKDRYKL